MHIRAIPHYSPGLFPIKISYEFRNMKQDRAKRWNANNFTPRSNKRYYRRHLTDGIITTISVAKRLTLWALVTEGLIPD